MHTSPPNELDQYLSEPLYAQNASLNLMKFFLQYHLSSYMSRSADIYVLFQMSEKIGKNRNFGAKIGINRKILKK